MEKTLFLKNKHQKQDHDLKLAPNTKINPKWIEDPKLYNARR